MIESHIADGYNLTYETKKEKKISTNDNFYKLSQVFDVRLEAVKLWSK